MPKGLLDLESRIGYRFQEARLLERALTHRSWANERGATGKEAEAGVEQNETLEFLGDSVLGLVIAEHLFKSHPGVGEGDLTLMKHHLVSSETLSQIAEELELGSFMRLGRGEEKTGGRKKRTLLADTLEAVIGAVFSDGGYVPGRTLVARLFARRLKEITPAASADYKSLLQESLHAQGREGPRYAVVRKEGPSHARTFWVEVKWFSGAARATGASIKSAEMEAARLALEEISGSNPKQSPERLRIQEHGKGKV